MIELRLLGSVDLRSDERTVHTLLAQPKRLALLAYLAVTSRGGFSRRDTLLGLFWPELDQERARAALRKTVHHLRQALGADAVVSRGDEELGIAEDVLHSDVAAFEAALDRRAHEDALALYRGDLLEGFFLGDAPEFEHWLDGERDRLRQRAAAAVESLAVSAAARGDHLAAAEWWRRLAAREPLNSRVAVGLVRALAASGDRAGALQHARSHEQLLRSELGAAPDAALVALMEQLKDGAIPFQPTGVFRAPPGAVSPRTAGAGASGSGGAPGGGNAAAPLRQRDPVEASLRSAPHRLLSTAEQPARPQPHPRSAPWRLWSATADRIVSDAAQQVASRETRRRLYATVAAVIGLLAVALALLS